jgi:hypothetical protein
VAFTVAASDGDRWWWLRWDKHLRGLAEMDPCPESRSSESVEETCLLPERHPGPHSYEIRTGLHPIEVSPADREEVRPARFPWGDRRQERPG